MTGLQPANRKLLDDATALGMFRTAAQVDTAADARIAAKRGAVNGVASLGADGLVPTAQLPAVSAPRLVVKATETAITTQALTAVTDMALTVPAGVYAIDGVLFLNTAQGSTMGPGVQLGASGGLVLAANSWFGQPTTQGLATTNLPGTVGSTSGYAQLAGVTAVRSTTATNNAEGRAVAGIARATTGGTLTLLALCSNASFPGWLQPGSWLRLTSLS